MMNLARVAAVGVVLVAGCRQDERKQAPAPSSQPAPRPGPGSRPAADGAAELRAAEGKARLEASEGGRLVLAAIEAHGGLSAWYGAGAIRFVYDYRPVDGPRRRSEQTVDLLSSRAYHELSHPVKGWFAWDGELAWMDVGGEPFPARFWALTPYYFVGMPFVLADPGVRLQRADDDPGLAGFSAKTDVVRASFEPGTGDAPDDYYVLYLDRASHRLIGLRYVVSYRPFMKPDMAHTPEKLIEYGDEAPAGPLRLARTHRFFAFPEGKKGALVTTATIEALEVGVEFEPARLERPPEAVIDSSLDEAADR